MTAEPHLGNLNLKAQGDYKRVLFVCTGGMLRSATAAHMMAAVADWNTRNAGTMDGALPTVNEYLVAWAEAIYCMEPRHADAVSAAFPWAVPKIKVLGIPDRFPYRDPELVDILNDKFAKEIKEAQAHDKK
jgi:predicted protein tyrosine phosphatase